MSTAQPTPKPGLSDRERGVYLAQRSKVLQAELRSLREERRQISEALGAVAETTSPEAKALRARRLYVRQRPDEARAELEGLIAERRGLAGARAAQG